MADGFAELIDRSNTFFAGLAENNRKDWFEPRKDSFVRDIRKPAELLGDLFAEDLARRTGVAHRPKLFRIYRDVRFSKDKTPYNAHLHLLWRQSGEGPAPAWFFGSAPDYLSFGLGLMDLRGPALTRFRAFIDRHGAALEAAMARAARRGAGLSDWGPPPLKRVPAPYGADHPQAGLLKRRALALHVPLTDGWRATGLLPAMGEAAQTLMPVWTILHEDF